MPAPLTFHELVPGHTYEMAVGDGLGGEHYVEGDHVELLYATPGQPMQCRNLRTGHPFYVSGASSFRRITQRYVTSLNVRVSFDAESMDDALLIARAIEETIAFPTPRGRSAALEGIDSRTQQEARR